MLAGAHFPLAFFAGLSAQLPQKGIQIPLYTQI